MNEWMNEPFIEFSDTGSHRVCIRRILYLRICVKNVQLWSWSFVALILKWQCHEIFCFWFFSWISFPPAPEYPIRTVSNFFGNSRRYSQVKVRHRCQRHRWQICHRYQRHRRQICHRCQWHCPFKLSRFCLTILKQSQRNVHIFIFIWVCSPK